MLSKDPIPPPPEPGPARTQPPERLVVGRVTGVWGLKGHVKVESLTDNPDRFRPGARLLAGPRECLCEDARRQGRALVVKLHGVDTREEAADLRGAILEIPTGDAPPLPDGTYYHHQVLGLEVWTSEGCFLGRIVEILETGGNDVYVVHGPGGEALIPAIADVVVSLDLGVGRITIEPMPGLLP